ncbi:unnamed protein product, partial [Ectocarpus sp. 13 AM-2016]
NRTNGTVKRGPTRVTETGRIAQSYSVYTAGLLRAVAPSTPASSWRTHKAQQEALQQLSLRSSLVQ